MKTEVISTARREDAGTTIGADEYLAVFLAGASGGISEGALLKKQADTPVSGNICLNICLFYQKSNFCLSLSKKL